MVTTLAYDADRQWLDTLVAGSGANRLDLDYAYDGVGNVAAIEDQRAGMEAQLFWYDDLESIVSFTM